MKKTILLLLFAAAIHAHAATTYTWKGGTQVTSGTPAVTVTPEYSTPTNWNPTRTTPASDDILIFDMANRDGNNTVGTITVNNVTTETIGQLQIISSTGGSSAGVKSLTFVGTPGTLTITGNLIFGWYAATHYSRLVDGGCTINVGGNITTTTAQAASSTYHQGTGRIVLTGANSSIMANATSNNEGFQNIEIASSATNVTFASTLQINGDLKINSGGKLVMGGKTLSLNATNGVGGTISGAGVIVGISTSLLYITGTGPASGVQTVGTINLDNSSSANCSLNGLNIQRPKAITTLGAGFNNGSENIINLGSIRLEDGTIDDGGNVLVCTGNPTIAITTPGGQTGVHQGTGKIRINRSGTGAIVTAGRTVTLNNLEIGSSSGAVAFTVGTATNLTINGTLTISKASSKFDASGSTVTFQNANTPISLPAAGTITTDASTNLKFGSTGNTGGSAFTIPNNAFTAAPSIASFTVNRDNALTFNNQTLTVSGATTITAGTFAVGTTLTTNGGATVNGTFQLNTGGYATGGTWTYGAAGTLAFNSSSGYGVDNTHSYWPTTNGPVNVSVLQGGLTLNSGANRSVSGLFQTAAGVSFPSATLTINGTAQINANGYFSQAPTYGASSTLKYNNGAVYGRGTEWNTTSPASVQVSNNSTLNYPNGSIVAAKSLTGNLTVDAGSAFYMDYGSVGQSNPLSVAGNVTLNGNLGLGGAIGGDLNVGGNWTRGSASNLYANTRAVTFNGSAAQSITSAVAGGESFDYLTINNTSGDVTVNTPMTINNSLNLTSGKLVIGSNDLTIGASGSISGGSATSYVVTNGAGKLIQSVGANATKLFPVGASVSSSYDPVTVTPVSASVMSAKVTSTLTGTSAGNVYLNPREWTIASATPSSTLVTLKPSQLNGTTTSKYATGALNSGSYDLTDATFSSGSFSNTYTSFGSFVTAYLDFSVALNPANLSRSSVYAANGKLVIENAKGVVEVYAASGQLVRSLNVASDYINVSLDKGSYIVKNGAKVSKVVIR